jgi:hypothetical protein
MCSRDLATCTGKGLPATIRHGFAFCRVSPTETRSRRLPKRGVRADRRCLPAGGVPVGGGAAFAAVLMYET